MEHIFPNVKSLCGEVHVFDLQCVKKKQGRDLMQTRNMEPFCFSGESANSATTFHLKFNLVLLSLKLSRRETGIDVDSLPLRTLASL